MRILFFLMLVILGVPYCLWRLWESFKADLQDNTLNYDGD